MEKNITKLAEGGHFTAVDLGKFQDIKDYIIPLPSGEELKGKVFVKEEMGATGTELSFKFLSPGEALPFFHIHKENEEIYIVIKGSGQMQVDDAVFPIVEGSVVRVAPAGKRCLRNNSSEPMVYMVIQVRENSLNQWTGGDGEFVSQEPAWD